MSDTITESQLDDFVAWREGILTTERDVSPRAYLAEIEARGNARRIQDAVEILMPLEGAYSASNTEEGAELVLELARGALNALIGGRSYIIDQTPTGGAKVIFT